jgi:hypothetical protein
VIAEVQHTEHHLLNDIHRVTCSGLAMTALVKSKAAGTIVRLELLSFFFFFSFHFFIHRLASSLIAFMTFARQLLPWTTAALLALW